MLESPGVLMQQNQASFGDNARDESGTQRPQPETGNQIGIAGPPGVAGEVDRREVGADDNSKDPGQHRHRVPPASDWPASPDSGRDAPRGDPSGRGAEKERRDDR